MSTISRKIDFAVIIRVVNANPNGDPLNGNRPRATVDNYGEISDVCIKRKIRNRLLQDGCDIFVQSDESRVDEFDSLSARFDAAVKASKGEDIFGMVCRKWIDVRSFGQVFAFKTKDKGDDKGVSIPVRGPVSIQPVISVDPVSITSIQITKSVNSESAKGKSSDTMGTRHRIDFGVYVIYGSINCELASKTGFSDEDAARIREALRTLFRNDSSSARPDGSMEVLRMFWWQHNCAAGQYSSAKVHRSLVMNTGLTPATPVDQMYSLTPLAGLVPEIIDGE